MVMFSLGPEPADEGDSDAWMNDEQADGSSNGLACIGLAATVAPDQITTSTPSIASLMLTTTLASPKPQRAPPLTPRPVLTKWSGHFVTKTLPALSPLPIRSPRQLPAVSPTQPLQLPAEITLQWMNRSTKQIQVRRGFLLHIDAVTGADTYDLLPSPAADTKLKAKSLVITAWPSGPAQSPTGVYYFGSLPIAEKIMRLEDGGIVQTLNGWRTIHSIITKPVRPSAAAESKQDNSEELLDDVLVACLLGRSQSTLVGGLKPPKRTRRSVSCSPSAAAAAAAKKRRREGPQRLPICYSLDHFRAQWGGPGFVNSAVVHALRDQLVDKIRECNAAHISSATLQQLYPKSTEVSIRSNKRQRRAVEQVPAPVVVIDRRPMVTAPALPFFPDD